ncbi:MAG TPA: LCP family protein, partial [Thermopolyspora sp.]
ARGARSRRRSLVVSGALSAAVLLGSGTAWFLPNYAAGQVSAVDAGTTRAEPRGALNILLVGVDKRDNLTRRQQNQLHLGRDVGQRTDTMMVIHLSEDHRNITVVSLPRDTWTDIPGQGMHKINSAYQFGGAKLAVRTVQKVTGLTINHYIEVNVLGFVDVVNALGGVEVCTPVAINDLKTKFTLAPGTHKLDGINALFYARTRATARADLDRIDRQQQVISALLQQALSGGTLANPVRLTALINSTLKTITVDQPLRDDLLSLAEQLRDVSTDNVAFTTVPLSNVDYKTPTGESAVLWDKAAAQDLFRRIRADEPLIKPHASKSAKPSGAPSGLPGKPAATASPAGSPPPLTIPPSRIAIRVLNGTGITGRGAHTKADLVKAGFQVPAPPGDTPTTDYQKTVIRYPAGREESARTVAAALPGAELHLANVEGIEVIVGREYPGARKVTISEPTPARRTPAPLTTPIAKTATQKICG